MSAPSGVLYDGCRDYTLSVSGSNPAAAEWTFETSLYAPSGETSSGDYAYGSGSAFSISPTFFICASEGAGTYTWTATTEWQDGGFNTVGIDNTSGTLTLRKQRTQTALRISDKTPRFNAVIRFKVKSTQETPDGYRRNSYAYVALEKKCRGTNGWVKVRGSKTFTNAYGKATLRLRYNTRKTCKVRALTRPDTTASASYSPKRRINPRG